ncbi:amino acid adenylation domain-containing protein [Streptomyces sp. 2333.5]|uniref:non-ribosomal peptide synthetase n=1 Tax=unclassified Streptomyces TaxID=2593676 RepID=UPI00089D5237|nr:MULTISPECIES: non-ribosomal peptide synthetase [unclassified Streptomyces]PJJ04981.1 amino acid adenylation domain-containing protein [Streptomyces sp. 2333.5]SEE65300.1 amino acid adenylation domain-containing protein [Streptomyces sp. 2314.4]SEE91832.1 amino acid adenylation domain-containing protein [Streptomyces sp. 2112.2]
MQLNSASRKESALWLLDKLLPGTGVNNIPVAFRLEGKLQAPVVADAISLLLQRHEALRTVFYADSAGLTKCIMPVERGELSVDFDQMEEGEDVNVAISRYALKPFSFDGSPLIRAGIFRGDGGDALCLVGHHLIFDVISADVLLKEFLTVYSDISRGGSNVGKSVEEITAYHEPEPKEQSLIYWRESLAAAKEANTDLWYSSSKNNSESLAGSQVTHQLSRSTHDAIKRMQKEAGVPEAVILLAAYYLLLSLHGAGPGLTVGTMVNTRPHEAPQAIGYHVNVLPLYAKIDLDKSFRELIRETRDALFEGIAHADVPVDILYDEQPRSGSSWRNPLFQHVFNYIPHFTSGDFEVGGAHAKSLSVETGYSKFDLEFFIMSSPGNLRVRAVYATGALSAEDVRLLLERYEVLLSSIAEDLDQKLEGVSFWSARDVSIIECANKTATETHPPIIADIHAQISRSVDAVAIEDDSQKVTYRQLWGAAQVTRSLLLNSGIGAGSVVAVMAPRSANLAAAVLGIWLAGSAYLPIDPEHPAHRIAYQLADSGAKAVLVASDADASLRTRLPILRMVEVDETVAGSVPRDLPDGAVTAECAYLIYTSGSTGRPKGTLVSHANLSNTIAYFRDLLGVTEQDSMLWLTTFSFDISALELLLPLSAGGRLIVAPDEARIDGGILSELIAKYEIGLLQATPTTWRLVVEECVDQLAGRRLLCGGEPLPEALARRLVVTGCRLYNVYGPTETTIWSTAGLIAADPGVRIDAGRPIANTQIFVMSPDGRELPLGLQGDLCIAGKGVSLGYHDRAEMTLERFREHPKYGRYYRTGDLARWCYDGSLQIAGRADRQIKVRGNRIELGEIETVLEEHPGVEAAAVVAVEQPHTDDLALVSFIVCEDEKTLDQLWSHARAHLPMASIPSGFTMVDQLATTDNGKIDYLALRRAALDAKACMSDTKPRESVGEPDELLSSLIKEWESILKIRGLSVESNFFASGGNSLLAAQLLQTVESSTGVRVSLAELFDHPTPDTLAGFIRKRAEALLQA